MGAIAKHHVADAQYERAPEIVFEITQAAERGPDLSSAVTWSLLTAGSSLLDPALPEVGWDQFWSDGSGEPPPGLGWLRLDEYEAWSVEVGVGGSFVLHIRAFNDDRVSLNAAAFLATTAWAVGPRLQDLVALAPDVQLGQTYLVMNEDDFLSALGPDADPFPQESRVAVFRKTDLDDDIEIPIVVRVGAEEVPRQAAIGEYLPLLEVVAEWMKELIVLALRREPTDEEAGLLVSACALALRMTREDPVEDQG